MFEGKSAELHRASTTTKVLVWTAGSVTCRVAVKAVEQQKPQRHSLECHEDPWCAGSFKNSPALHYLFLLGKKEKPQRGRTFPILVLVFRIDSENWWKTEKSERRQPNGKKGRSQWEQPPLVAAQGLCCQTTTSIFGCKHVWEELLGEGRATRERNTILIPKIKRLWSLLLPAASQFISAKNTFFMRRLLRNPFRMSEWFEVELDLRSLSLSLYLSIFLPLSPPPDFLWNTFKPLNKSSFPKSNAQTIFCDDWMAPYGVQLVLTPHIMRQCNSTGTSTCKYTFWDYSHLFSWVYNYQ